MKMMTNEIVQQRQTIFEKEAEINSMRVNDVDSLTVAFMTLDLEKQNLFEMGSELDG